jgi:nitric oxide dioxygenase
MPSPQLSRRCAIVAALTLPAAAVAPTYGARPEHYPVVGPALLWTLEQGLGKEWTGEVADAWTAAYAMLSDFMINQAWGRPQAAE